VPWSIQVLLELAITLIIASLSYGYLEKPVLRLKPRSPGRHAPPVA